MSINKINTHFQKVMPNRKEDDLFTLNLQIKFTVAPVHLTEALVIIWEKKDLRTGDTINASQNPRNILRSPACCEQLVRSVD